MSKSPRERRQERTRQAILNTAVELIEENGPDNVSLREIARRIDYSPAGLYEYFGSKDEIIDAVCSIGNEKLWSYLSRVSTELPFLEYMEQLLKAYIDFALENAELFVLVYTRLTAGAMALPDAVESVSETDSFGILLRAVQRGIDEGHVQVTDETRLVDIAYSLWSHAHGAAMLQITYLQSVVFDFDRANKHAVRALLKGLAP